MNNVQILKQTLINDVRKLRDNIERFYASKPYARCVYTNPEPNFNRKNVYGVTCDLIEVKNKENCTAIETAAGGMVSIFAKIMCLFSRNIFMFLM